MQKRTFFIRMKSETLDNKEIKDFIDKGGMIQNIPFFKHPDKKQDLEFPILPKGKKIPCQDHGCLMIPRYNGG